MELIEQIKRMGQNELVELRGKIRDRLNDLDAESDLPGDPDELGKLADAIDERAAELKKAAEKRENLIARMSEQRGQRVGAQNAHEEEPQDIRATRKYAAAFLRALKTGDQRECRALLSTNGTNESLSLTGYVPVPTYLEKEIKTAWEEHKLLGLVKHSFLKGNVEIGFELTATGASVHLEGDDEPDEEVITLGTVKITAENIKKWITVSDEALEGTDVDTMGYLLKEIAYKIVEKAEEIILAKIDAAPTTATASAVSVEELEVEELAVDTVTDAAALVSGAAKQLVAVMNRRTEAGLKKTGKNANYNVDPFDGIERVITDKLPAFADADDGDTVMVIGDFANGAQANFPNGDTVMMKIDDKSLSEKDLVKIVGREYVGFGLIADKHFVRVVKTVVEPDP